MNRKELGQKGESLAVDFLERHGFEIVAKNVILPSGEIDIVARRGTITAIIEVKTSAVSRFGQTAFAPELRVNSRKQRKLIALGKHYCAKAKIPHDRPWEIDVIGVEIGPFDAHEVHLWRQAVVE